jgi:hypothetical protein
MTKQTSAGCSSSSAVAVARASTRLPAKSARALAEAGQPAHAGGRGLDQRPARQVDVLQLGQWRVAKIEARYRVAAADGTGRHGIRELPLQAEGTGDRLHRVDGAGAGNEGVGGGGERAQDVDHHHRVYRFADRIEAIQEDAAGTHGGR